MGIGWLLMVAVVLYANLITENFAIEFDELILIWFAGSLTKTNALDLSESSSM